MPVAEPVLFADSASQSDVIKPASAPAGSAGDRLASARREGKPALSTPAPALKAASRDVAKAGSPSYEPKAVGSVSLVEVAKTKDVRSTYVADELSGQKLTDGAVQTKSGSTVEKSAQTLAMKVPSKAFESNTTFYNVSANSQVAMNRADVGMRYRNLASGNSAKTEAAAAVLDEFTVSQNGEALTVVDRDGSVYNGFTRLAEVSRANYNQDKSGAMQVVKNADFGGRGGQLFNRASDSDGNYKASANQSQNFHFDQGVNTLNAPAQNLAANYYFRVEGTNRSLNQRVVFSGNIVQSGAVPNGYNNTYNNYAANTQAANFQNSQPVQQLAPGQNGSFNNLNSSQNSMAVPFINGRVQIDNKPASELNAMPVER
jgi:hypothetical protein